MDPISIIQIVGSVVSLGDTVFKCIAGLRSLKNKYYDAPLVISTIVGQLHLVQSALDELAIWNKPEHQCDPRYQQLAWQIGNALDCFGPFITALERRLGDLELTNGTNMTTTERLAFLWSEKEMSEFSVLLDRQVNALNLLLQALQWYQIIFDAPETINMGINLIVVKRLHNENVFCYHPKTTPTSSPPAPPRPSTPNHPLTDLTANAQQPRKPPLDPSEFTDWLFATPVEPPSTDSELDQYLRLDLSHFKQVEDPIKCHGSRLREDFQPLQANPDVTEVIDDGSDVGEGTVLEELDT
ncbi:hypothetical protein O1611_g8936 [Lasiodiplodia mahajangana]|uniref:Uncharacterized protein n=1 Tax=Lasiodiplodia mahajangana TaxID=1108764 RepID=A0ACC2JBF8_9PEZI|nr:hypothetical protein O1611_g8936 [Lasiodiplodia mahajangana]